MIGTYTKSPVVVWTSLVDRTHHKNIEDEHENPSHTNHHVEEYHSSGITRPVCFVLDHACHRSDQKYLHEIGKKHTHDIC